MKYFFKSIRLGFRPWETNDLDSLAQMLADKQVMEYYPSTRTREQAAAFFNRISKHYQQHGFCLYAVDLLTTGEFAGYIGFQHFDFDVAFAPNIEIGWMLKAENWGHGLATEGAERCLQYGWDQFEFDKIYSFTALLNERSERVMQKIGMQKTGDFDHPKLDKGHALERHVLYEIERPLPH